MSQSKYQRNTFNCFFPDQKEPDPANREEFKSYWKREKSRCIDGFYLGDGQVYISGWLYFYCVYWCIEKDWKIVNKVTGKETSAKKRDQPTLRDNEWIIAEDMERAEREKGIYVVAGSRGFGKSFSTSSIIGHTFTFVDDSESLLTGGNTADIGKLAEKVEMGLSNLHPVFQKQRLKNNWKLEVRAGWIDKKTGLTKGSNSRILTRNYNDGLESMATNGTRPVRQIIEESGKIPGLIQCVRDSIPSWMNEYGFFSVPIMIGTGGDMEKGEDFGKIFNNPGQYYGLEFEDTWEGSGSIGRFFPVTMARDEYKEWMSLYDYLTLKFPDKYENLKPHPELTNVKIKVSNEEKCMQEFVIPRREKAEKEISGNNLISEKAYYPIKPSECFLKLDSNDFPVELIGKHQLELEKNEFRPRRIKLERGVNGVITWEDTDDLPVSDFPVTSSSNKKGVVEIIELPVSNAPSDLYVSGLDPYKISESDYSTSLGSVTIWKRMTNDPTEPFQDMPVAWYTGRPPDIRDWHETALMLIELYNSSCMSESNDESFIQYVMTAEKEYLLARGQEPLKELNPNTRFKGKFGMPANTTTVKQWNNTLVRYTKEKMNSFESFDGSVKEVYGVHKILDYMLLEEMKKFNKDDPKGNYDRIRSCSIAKFYANYLDANLGTVEAIKTAPIKPEKYIKTPFSMGSGISPSSNLGMKKLNSPFNLGKI